MLVCSLMITAGSLSAQVISELPPFERAIAVIKHFEGLHNKAEHYPYVGYGHKVLPGENLSMDMTEEEADRLLRSDLMKLCKMFSGYGQDSLLLATLAYNVGAYRLLGYGGRPKSRLVQMLDEGDRNIYREYITFRKYVKFTKLCPAFKNTLYLCIKHQISNEKSNRLHSCFY